MKYEITCACGHNETHDIFGTNVHGERDKKAAYLATRLCKDCYAKAQAAAAAKCEVELVTMHYSEYKNNYAGCKTAYNSYDKKTKTIDVYVPTVRLEQDAKEAEAKATKETEVAEEVKAEEATETATETTEAATTETIVNSNGTTIDFNTAVNLMDIGIMDELFHHDIETPQEYFRAYCNAHERKYNEMFELDKENPVY